MTDDDKFFERLRGDAAMLRHRVDEATLDRMRERIHDRIYARIAPRVTVFDVLASWIRPLGFSLAALALAAAIGLSMNVGDAPSLGDESVDVVMGGDTYRVGN